MIYIKRRQVYDIFDFSNKKKLPKNKLNEKIAHEKENLIYPMIKNYLLNITFILTH